jgi:hypothetical protein
MALTANILSIQKKSFEYKVFGWYRIQKKKEKESYPNYEPTIVLLTSYGAIYFTLYAPGEPYEMSYSSRDYFDETYMVTGTYEADLSIKLKEI